MPALQSATITASRLKTPGILVTVLRFSGDDLALSEWIAGGGRPQALRNPCEGACLAQITPTV